MKEESNKNFVVVGCGMVGVVLAIELKRRLPGSAVTLVEKRTEAEALDGSWMIGLAMPGIKALSRNPALLETVKKSGCETSEAVTQSLYVNGLLIRKYTPPTIPEGFSRVGLDRGINLKACLSHLRDEYPDVDIHFGCKLVNVNEEEGTITTEPPLPLKKFDMLFGADGAHSSVRRCCSSIARGASVVPFPQDLLMRRIILNPLEDDLSDFPKDLRVYVSTKPPPGPEATVTTKYSSKAKPLTNTAMVYSGTFKADGESTMHITDVFFLRDHVKLSRSPFPQTQEELEENMKQLGMPQGIHDKLKLGETNRERVIYTVKATQYHNDAGNVAILGDAAHATFPSLGAGYNTGLQDVETLVDLLCENKGSKLDVLAAYSKQRVPVGRALVDVSNLLAYNPSQLASTAGSVSMLRAGCRLLGSCLTCGLFGLPAMFSNALFEYQTGEKTTVELADEWKRDIAVMNREMKMWETDRSASVQMKLNAKRRMSLERASRLQHQS